MLKRIIVLMSLLLGGVLVVTAFAAKKPSVQPAAVVSTATAKSTDYHPSITAVGTLKAVNGVDVSADVDGIVDQINFHSGQMVKAGQVLVVLRHADLQANVDSDEASLASDERDYHRYKMLLARGIISRESDQLDKAETNVAKDKASLAKDTAALDKTIVKAPFAGRVGIRQVDLGQYVAAGKGMVNLQQIQPIYADFDLPENSLQGVKVGSTVDVNTTLYPKQVFTGEISALGSTLDPQTRTLPVRANLPNKLNKLLPGMYAEVKVLLPTTQQVIVIPQSAITYNPYGDAVYVVKDGKVHSTFITVGQLYGDNAVVEKGLKAGDEVVIAGQNKLHEGATVKVSN